MNRSATFTRQVLLPGMAAFLCLAAVQITVVSFGHWWWPILWDSPTFSWTAYTLYLLGFVIVGCVGAVLARRAGAGRGKQYLAGALPGLVRLTEAVLVLAWSYFIYSGALRAQVLHTVSQAELQKGVTPTAMMLFGVLIARLIRHAPIAKAATA